MKVNKRSFFLKLSFLLVIISIPFRSEGQQKVKEAPIRIACLGNSVTFGTKINKPVENSYPAQLQELLGSGYKVGNFGFPGATILKKGHKPIWEKPVFKEAENFKPDKVIIHLGLNDTDPRNWPNYNSEFRSDYLDLIHHFQNLYKDKPTEVMICRMTPIFSWHPRFYTGTREYFRAIQLEIEEIAHEAGVPLIDLHTSLKNRPDLFDDSIHPNAEGARIIANEVSKYIDPKKVPLKLHSLFTEGMVYPRNQDFIIKGRAPLNTRIKIQFNGTESEVSTGHSTQFEITFETPEEPGPYSIKLTTSQDSIRIEEIFFGEVWLASGQSNMVFELSKDQFYSDISDQLADERIHLYQMEAVAYPYSKEFDQDQLELVNKGKYFTSSGWQVSDSASASSFSAIGYYFARMLADSLNCHVGLIHNAVGGANTESWVSRSKLENKYDWMSLLSDWSNSPLISEWCHERATINLTQSTNPRQQHPYAPGYLFGAGISTIMQYPVSGVIWYQGESNAENPDFHTEVFKNLVESWRTAWQNPTLPFLFVQLSSIERAGWGAFRNSQRLLADNLPYTEMAVSSDLGHPSNVHPKNKRDVATRLGRIALGKVYDMNCPYQGPQIIQSKQEGSSVRAWFDHADGLNFSSREGMGFETAGPDSVFYPAKAKIEGITILLFSELVKKPKFIRYGWADYSPGNLYNGFGLPASTFSTLNN